MVDTDSNKNFALIGAAGYVAPRHMKAIKETGNILIAAYDPNDSVGVIDSYFPETHFFTEFERFDRHIDKISRLGCGIHYASICSPNYLHDAHCRFALRSGATVICEKPLVLNPWNVDGLEQMENHTGSRIYTILQLRLHPAVIALKERVKAEPDKIHDIDLSYITPRGRWYHVSWKGDPQKSGGVAANIGVHFFDMLSFVFGPMTRNIVHHRSNEAAAGYLEFARARVRWFLSVNSAHLPERARGQQSTYRSILMDEEEVDFSNGFTDLHTASYKAILAGRGFGLEEARSAIEIISDLAKADVLPHKGDQHPMLRQLWGNLQS